jgi:hypothetical protein
MLRNFAVPMDFGGSRRRSDGLSNRCRGFDFTADAEGEPSISAFLSNRVSPVFALAFVGSTHDEDELCATVRPSEI